MFGLKIFSSSHCYKTEEDWSKVRSPSRALRRLRRGFKQNITTKQIPTAVQIGNEIFAHPSIYHEIMRKTNGHQF